MTNLDELKSKVREAVDGQRERLHEISLWLYENPELGSEEFKAAELLTNELEKHGFKVKQTSTPAMYRSFVSSIRGNGRVHEFGMMFMFYLRTNPLAALKILPMGLQLFLHKRMPLMPKKVKGREDLAKIIQRFREVRGAR